MQRLLQNQKMVDDCVQEKGTRAGASELKSCLVKFPISQPLVRGSSQQRCGFKPSLKRPGSGPLNNVIKAWKVGFSLHASYAFVLQRFPTVHFLTLCAGMFRGGATMITAHISAVA
jgi:hypothetical protein